MKSAANWQKPDSPDPTLDALARAMQEIAPSDKATPSAFDWDDEPAAPEISSSENSVKPAASENNAKPTPSENYVKPTFSRSIEPVPPTISERFASLGQRFAFSKVYAWGLIALVGVGAYVFVWSSPNRHVVQLPAAVSPAATETKGAAAPAVSPAQAAEVSNPVQPKLKDQATSEITPSSESLERRLTSLEHGIEELKTAQAKLTASNIDLANAAKLAREKLAQSVGDLASALRAAEERGARERAAAAEQLRLNQEQLAKINEQLNAAQAQAERRRAVGPSQHAVRVTSPQQPSSTTSTAPKPALRPASVQAGARPPRPSSTPQPAR